jgi:hypothetical protein
MGLQEVLTWLRRVAYRLHHPVQRSQRPCFCDLAIGGVRSFGPPIRSCALAHVLSYILRLRNTVPFLPQPQAQLLWPASRSLAFSTADLGDPFGSLSRARYFCSVAVLVQLSIPTIVLLISSWCRLATLTAIDNIEVHTDQMPPMRHPLLCSQQLSLVAVTHRDLLTSSQQALRRVSLVILSSARGPLRQSLLGMMM